MDLNILIFIIRLIVCALAVLVCISITIKNYQKKKRNKNNILIKDSNYQRKKDNLSLILSIIGIILSVWFEINTLLNSVPTPIIYPLDNEARIYNETAKVDIKSYPIFTVYYSLDGSDPKDGTIYTDSFTITKTTTVVARNRFLHFFWSDPYPNTFRFDNTQVTTATYVNENVDFQTIKQVLLLSILAFAIICGAIKKLFKLFKL